jgi:hypothetical protein
MNGVNVEITGIDLATSASLTMVAVLWVELLGRVYLNIPAAVNTSVG